MLNKQSVKRQRLFGGVLGMLLLSFALAYHFFPECFQISLETGAARGIVSLLGQASISPAGTAHQSGVLSGMSKIKDFPAITPSAVIAWHRHDQANIRHRTIPTQMSADTTVVRSLLVRARRAYAAGHLIGYRHSAGSLYARALHEKPDSQAAARGLNRVIVILVKRVRQAIAMYDIAGARQVLLKLGKLPGTIAEVTQLGFELKNAQRVHPLLVQADKLLKEGKIDMPGGISAWSLYRRVCKIDPYNLVAAHGLLRVQRIILDRALVALAHNHLEAASRALTEARGIDPSAPQWKNVQGRVAQMRRARADDILMRAHAALDTGDIPMAMTLATQAQATAGNQVNMQSFQRHLTYARLYANYKPGQIFTDNYRDLSGHAPSMVVIPVGHFMMGSSIHESGHGAAESPRHRVTITRGFAMARSAVTVGQFREFVEASHYRTDAQRLGGAVVYNERSGTMRLDAKASWQDDYAGHPVVRDDWPVVNVSWRDASAYAHWLSQRTGKNYQLPSEAQFEYALRAGTKTRYWWGNTAPKQKFENTAGGLDRSPKGRRWKSTFRDYGAGYWGPAPVMTFKANRFGLYDMGGNVSEWVTDCWHDNYIRAPSSGRAWINLGCVMRVIRGGSWASSTRQARSAFRQKANQRRRSGHVGFRVVREFRRY